MSARSESVSDTSAADSSETKLDLNADVSVSARSSLMMWMFESACTGVAFAKVAYALWRAGAGIAAVANRSVDGDPGAAKGADGDVDNATVTDSGFDDDTSDDCSD